MRIMGLDIGTERIGVAISDEKMLLAHGRAVVKRTSDTEAISRIMEMIGGLNVRRIVIGLPVNMNGTRGPRAEDCVRFAEKLKSKTLVPVKLWDERLSTSEAENILLAADVTRKRRKEVADKLAAQIILQGYLDSLREG